MTVIQIIVNQNPKMAKAGPREKGPDFVKRLFCEGELELIGIVFFICRKFIGLCSAGRLFTFLPGKNGVQDKKNSAAKTRLAGRPVFGFPRQTCFNRQSNCPVAKRKN